MEGALQEAKKDVLSVEPGKSRKKRLRNDLEESLTKEERREVDQEQEEGGKVMADGPQPNSVARKRNHWRRMKIEVKKKSRCR